MQQTIPAHQVAPTKKLFKKISFIDLDKKILFVLVLFFIMSLRYQSQPLLLIVPFLGLAYLLGFSYLLIALFGGLCSILVYMPEMIYLYVLLSISFLLIVLFMRVFKLSLFNRIYLSVFLSEIISRSFFIFAELEPFSLLYAFLPFIATLLIYGLSGLSTMSVYKSSNVFPY